MPPETSACTPAWRVPALDGLRGVAVLLVFLFHYGGGLHVHGLFPHLLGSLTEAGWIGVELFFVLSGYLITGILLQMTSQPRSLRNFFARRALRILPLYAFALVLCAAAALLHGARLFALAPLAVYAGFLQNIPRFVETALHTPPPLPVFHLWSLAVEEQFYLVWPFVVLLARTPARVARVSLLVFATVVIARCVVFALLPFSHAALWASCFPLRGGSLVLGSFLAAQRRPAHPLLRRAAWPIPAALLAIFLTLGTWLHSFLLASPRAFSLLLPAASLLCAAAVTYARQSARAARVLSWAPLAALGRISYGVYVFHILLQPAFDALAHWLTRNSSGTPYHVARLVVALPLTIVAAMLSFRLLERPFLHLRRHFPEPAAVPATP